MFLAVTTETIDSDSSRSEWLRVKRTWACFVFALIMATWELWVPNQSFPSIPMFGTVIAQDVVAWLAIGALAGLLIAVMARQSESQLLYGAIAVAFVFAFVNNQHRLQPWAYQAMLQSIVLASMSPRPALRWLRILTISIYFYSACGKFDYQFLHTVGQDFVGTIFGQLEGPPSPARLLLAGTLPGVELAIAIGLCVRASRRWAGAAAMGMHLSLIGLLGPWNLDHSLGVVLWNACLSIQAWYLFYRVRTDEVAARLPAVTKNQSHATRGFSFVGLGVILMALVFPLGERQGYWDHWLSWALYSPHTSRVDVELHASVLSSLDRSQKTFVNEDDDDDQWHEFAIDQWSLSALQVPIYPQARFQLGVVRDLAASLGLRDGIRVKVKSTANRWTGAREERWLQGGDEIAGQAERYWLLAKQY